MNKRTLPDQAARDLIVRRLDLNLLVEASAGSGKTESLARRMAAVIVSGQYRVEQMAAVTFTRKAAAELRGRFQIVLERKMRADGAGSLDQEERQRVQHALSNLERLFTGTIHSFCAHLLRERPVEAGLAPGFGELDELQDNAFREQAWRDFLARERSAGSAALNELRAAGFTPKDLDGAFARVASMMRWTSRRVTASRCRQNPHGALSTLFGAGFSGCCPSLFLRTRLVRSCSMQSASAICSASRIAREPPR